MTREEREEPAKRICNFYKDATNQSIKTPVNYFKKNSIPEKTIRYILKKCPTHGTTKFLLRKGRSVKINNKQLNDLVKTVNNKTRVSVKGKLQDVSKCIKQQLVVR